jgi:ribonuclease HI
MFTLHQSIKDEVQVLHVNGHVGVEGNELADRMSMIAIDTKEVGFTKYRGDLNVKAILAMRAGK